MNKFSNKFLIQKMSIDFLSPYIKKVWTPVQHILKSIPNFYSSRSFSWNLRKENLCSWRCDSPDQFYIFKWQRNSQNLLNEIPSVKKFPLDLS